MIIAPAPRASRKLIAFAILLGALSASTGTASARVYHLPGGGSLTVKHGALSPGAKMVVRRAKHRRLPGHTRSLGRPVSLRIARGRLVGSVLLRFPYHKRIDPLGMPLDLTVQIGYYDRRVGKWKTVPAHVNRLRRTVTARLTPAIWNEANLVVDTKGARASAASATAAASGSSWWNPFSWDWGSIILRLDQRIGELRGGRTGPAHCTSGVPVPSWALISVSNAADLPFRMCTEGQGDKLVVQIVNNRPYSVILKYGAPVSWGWHEQPAEADKAVGAMMGDALVSPNELYIAPLKAASVGIPRGAWRSADFHASVTAKSIGADVMTWIASQVDTRLVRREAIGKLAAECSKVLKPGIDGDVQVNDNVLDVVAGVAHCFENAMPKLRASGLLDAATTDRLQHAVAVFARVGLAIDTARVAGKVADLYFGLSGDLQGLTSFDVFRQGVDLPPSPTPTPGPPLPNPPGTPLPPLPPRTWPEQQGSHGANTFTNPFNASGMGVKIAAYQWVDVACKVYAPQIVSANPDGYWYRIATAPWSGSYYAVANTFWNGDIPGQLPYTHNTDWAVPDC